jgi:anion-transporting  ArsA/GET3 family ATPase
MNVAELLEGKRVCVCGGPGGVGKTATSAAIALGMAAQGAKVAVITIDPAKRLANALGLEGLQNDPTRVSSGHLARNGVEMKGELWAMMLDSKRTFDELIDGISSNPSIASDIKNNRMYRELSTAISGSQEFAAIAKLYELHRAEEFDLLVLDTPPTRNALDFLDAPDRLTSFLDGRALRLFMRPAGIGMRVLGGGASPLFGALRHITGIELLADMSILFQLLGDMTGRFSQRAAEVKRMLRASSTVFVLVTSAQDGPVNEAIWFYRVLAERGLPFAGVVTNRIRRDYLAGAAVAAAAAPLMELVDFSLAIKVVECARDHQVLAERDERNVARLASEIDGAPLLLVPQFDDDVHDLQGLKRLSGYLFASKADAA